MDLVSASPNHVIREMTPKGNVIRESTEIQQVIRDPYTPFQTLLFQDGAQWGVRVRAAVLSLMVK